MNKPFNWNEFDLSSELDEDKVKQVFSVAEKYVEHKVLSPNSITSREAPSVAGIATLTVEGNTIKNELPWLFDLYLGKFYEIGRKCVNEPLYTAKNDTYAVNLNIQKGVDMRYECHIDSNPLQGVFYITSHDPGDGGELVVSNNEKAIGVEEIDTDSVVIYPKSGKLLLFNANYNPHYVRPLTRESDVRIAVTMNYYTERSPESDRPEDLDGHLFN